MGGPTLSIFSAVLSCPATATRDAGLQALFRRPRRYRGSAVTSLALMGRADVPRERKQADGHGNQDAEDQAEIVEEMGVLFAHGRRSILVVMNVWRARQDSNQQ